MLSRFVWALTLIVSLVFVPLAVAHDEHDHGPMTGTFGDVKFSTSCDKSVQADFQRAVAILHSFWYDGAEEAFTAVTKKDPECAMAYWGIAMSLHHPLWALPNKADVERGKEALAKARNAKHQTPQERGWIDAIAAVYEAPEGSSLVDRNKAWAAGMEKVYNADPKNSEAETFYLLAKLSTASPKDKTYAVQKEVGPRLEKLFEKQPTHPGLAHYVIHTYDSPALASMGLDAARRYAKIAPDAAHALHMPSHIFTRLGLWQDSIQSNTDSARVGRANYARSHNPAPLSEQLHAMDYLTYAYLQRGEVANAKKLLDELNGLKGQEFKIFSASYAASSIPSRFAVETHRWSEARDIPEPNYTGESYWTEVANSIVYWARSLGASRTGQVDRARADLAKIEGLRDKLLQSKKQDGADTVEVMRLSALGWIASADGKKDEAVRLLREAADLEDRTDKHPVTPGAVQPAREQLAELLAETGKPADALAEYETSLKTAPNRFNGLSGAARAAKASGNNEKAKQYYAKLLEVAPNADAQLLHDTKEYMASK
jgi:tetratricopeptide (TPR) repeat protein